MADIKQDALAQMSVACAIKENLIGIDVLEAMYDRLVARGHIIPPVSADGINLILSEAGIEQHDYLAVKIAEAIESGNYTATALAH